MVRNIIRIFLCVLISVPSIAIAQSQPAQPETTIHAVTDLVVVDVTVTDHQQNPIRQLNLSDFTVLEDGKPQTVKIFEEHDAAAPAPMPELPRFDPGTYTNITPAPTSGALNILLFDKLNTPLNAQGAMLDQVLKFLKQEPAGTRMAIFTMNPELKLLQGFTSDPKALRAILESTKGLSTPSPLLNDAVQGDEPGSDDQWTVVPQASYGASKDPMTAVPGSFGNNTGLSTMMTRLQEFQAEHQMAKIQLRARYTLDALNQLARYMSSLKGRKNLIWFSGSFPISILPDPEWKDSIEFVTSVDDEFRETIDLLTRSQVAVYPIDAKRLMTDPVLNAANSGEPVDRNVPTLSKSEANFESQTFSENVTMNQLAEGTGGKVFKDTNDLTGSIEKAIAAGSSYYTLAYTPTNRHWDQNFRKILVKLDRPGVTLSYRKGYLADDPTLGPHPIKGQNAKPDETQYNALRAAMQWGAPDPTEIIFTANVRPSIATPEDSVAPGNKPGPKIAGPYRRYTVRYLVKPSQVDCKATPDGVHHCTLEFRTYVYDADGTLVNLQANGIQANLPAEKYAEMIQHNFAYTQQISVPVKGMHFLRIGVRDTTSDRIGALEMRVASVAGLKPVSEDTAATVTPGAPK